MSNVNAFVSDVSSQAIIFQGSCPIHHPPYVRDVLYSSRHPHYLTTKRMKRKKCSYGQRQFSCRGKVESVRNAQVRACRNSCALYESGASSMARFKPREESTEGSVATPIHHHDVLKPMDSVARQLLNDVNISERR